MAKKKTPAPTIETAPSETLEQLPVTYLDPAIIMLDPEHNIRFGMRRHTLDSLKEDIITAGGVETPIDVEMIAEADRPNGYSYVVRRGNRRLTAVQELNKEAQLGLTIPAYVRTYADPVTRIKRQLAENREREDMSPMDNAKTIRMMFDQGMSRQDVCQAFARPTSVKNKEGAYQQKLVMKPASNSWVNMTLSFLDFPKAIQAKIDDGRIGVKGAYKLRKYKSEDWEKIVAQFEDERIKEIEAYEKEETIFLAGGKKEAEAAQKKEEHDKKLAEAQALVQATGLAEKEAVENLKKAQDERLAIILGPKADKETKKKAEEYFRAADNLVKSAKETYGKAKRDLEKIEDSDKRAQKIAEERRQRLADARAKQTPMSDADVQAAANKTGAVEDRTEDKQTFVKLNVGQMRFYCESVVKFSGSPVLQPKTRVIGEALVAALDGKITDGQLYAAICKACGEWKDNPAKK